MKKLFVINEVRPHVVYKEDLGRAIEFLQGILGIPYGSNITCDVGFEVECEDDLPDNYLDAVPCGACNKTCSDLLKEIELEKNKENRSIKLKLGTRVKTPSKCPHRDFADEAIKNRRINEIGTFDLKCCAILYCIFGIMKQYLAQFLKLKII